MQVDENLMQADAPALRIVDDDPRGGSAGEESTPLSVALRRKWSILFFALCVTAGVHAVISRATPRYAAQAQVRLDMPQPRITDENATLLPTERPTMEELHTEMAALSSPSLARRAAVSMGLPALTEFQNCPQAGWVARLSGVKKPLPACVVSADYAAKVLLASMSFEADKESFVIRIGASASDPDLAARMANGYARAYVDWQRDFKARLASDANDWLSRQLQAMHDKMVTADREVENYRQVHKLVGVRAGQDGNSADTLNTNQLSQANMALGDTMSGLAEKQSTLVQVRQALRDQRYNAVAPALQSPVVQTLVERKADLSAQLAQMRAHYGLNYPGVISLAAQGTRVDGQIRMEIEHVAAGLESELKAMSAKRAAIESHVTRLAANVAGESQNEVGLKEREREATTDRSVYEALFVRLKQVDAERFLERANADVVVEATPSDFAVFPKKRLMDAGAFLACLGIGTGLAFAHNITSRRFRDAGQIEAEIGLPVIGIFAKRRSGAQSIALDHPDSIEAEAVHAVLTQVLPSRARRDQRGLTLMLTSALPREGKSCFTVALARAASSAGFPAVVLDCDLRRPSIGDLMSADLASDKARVSIAEPSKISGSSSIEDMVSALLRQAHMDQRSGVLYLQLSDYIENPRGLLTWPGLPALLQHLRANGYIVLLDTPPVLVVSDALHLGPLADQVLMMIDWSATPRQAVAAGVQALNRAGVAVSGAVMTKVDMRRYARQSGRTQYLDSQGAYLRHAA